MSRVPVSPWLLSLLCADIFLPSLRISFSEVSRGRRKGDCWGKDDCRNDSARGQGGVHLRIEGVRPEEADDYARRVLEAQAKRWGAPLTNHLVYARRPTIFRGARAMWTGIDGSGLIGPRLQALVNRRVASINGCEF